MTPATPDWAARTFQAAADSDITFSFRIADSPLRFQPMPFLGFRRQIRCHAIIFTSPP
jgi:hypothetical protein